MAISLGIYPIFRQTQLLGIQNFDPNKWGLENGWKWSNYAVCWGLESIGTMVDYGAPVSVGPSFFCHKWGTNRATNPSWDWKQSTIHSVGPLHTHMYYTLIISYLYFPVYMNMIEYVLIHVYLCNCVCVFTYLFTYYVWVYIVYVNTYIISVYIYSVYIYILYICM